MNCKFVLFYMKIIFRFTNYVQFNVLKFHASFMEEREMFVCLKVLLLKWRCVKMNWRQIVKSWKPSDTCVCACMCVCECVLRNMSLSNHKNAVCLFMIYQSCWPIFDLIFYTKYNWPHTVWIFLNIDNL